MQFKGQQWFSKTFQGLEIRGKIQDFQGLCRRRENAVEHTLRQVTVTEWCSQLLHHRHPNPSTGLISWTSGCFCFPLLNGFYPAIRSMGGILSLLFVIHSLCTVTDFSVGALPIGVKFCMAVQPHLRQVFSYFGGQPQG